MIGSGSMTSWFLRAAAALALLPVLTLGGCAKPHWAPPPQTGEPVSVRFQKAQSLVADAQRAEDAGKTDDAIRLYQDALSSYPEMPIAWNNLGRLLMARNEGMDAAAAFRRAADLAPKDPRPVYNLGVLWEQRGYAEDAATFYTQALERDENYLDALRASIRLDTRIRQRPDDKTARRLRQALLLEQDPAWRAFFMREKVRVDAILAEKAGTLAR